MTPTPESWRRICAVLDRVSELDPSLRVERMAEACAAEGISVEDVTLYLAAEYEARLPDQIDPGLREEALRGLALEQDALPVAPGEHVGP